MSLISPFTGLRPKQEFAEDVVAPPYDVLNTEEARQRANGRPRSFLHISKPEIDLPVGTDPFEASVYAKGAENLNKLVMDDVLFRDSSPKYYVYKLVMGEHEQTGLVAAASVADYDTNRIRKPLTSDYIKFVKVVDQLNNIASQSTAMIPSDVNEQISDSYRLFLSLLYGKKPVITGTFTIDSFEVMKNMQLTVRGSAKQLKEKPLTVFSCCPTSPLKWSDVTSQNVIDCGVYGIPVEFIAMPLTGFMAPVT